jgi:formamidopyrimidine-DNA glycosylase
VPELPEVETVRRRIEPLLAGRTIVRAEILDARLVRPLSPEAVAAELRGGCVTAVERRGKYLLVRFADHRTLVVHLRMTGSFRHVRPGEAHDGAHVRARLALDDGSELLYRDVRRFGTWDLFAAGESEPYLAARLGPEPLGRFTPAALARRIGARSAPIKAVLLDQRVIAGLGNIYVDEALWHARVHPQRPARGLDEDELRRLHRAIRRVLRLGIERQGATLRDYATPEGGTGSMQHEFRVYGRDGEPCDRCGAEIAKTRVAGRGTWTCGRCQRPPG